MRRAATLVSNTRVTERGTEYLGMELYEKYLTSERGIRREAVQDIPRKGPTGFRSLSTKRIVESAWNADCTDELFSLAGYSPSEAWEATNSMMIRNPKYFSLIDTKEVDRAMAYLIEERGMSLKQLPTWQKTAPRGSTMP